MVKIQLAVGHRLDAIESFIDRLNTDHIKYSYLDEDVIFFKDPLEKNDATYILFTIHTHDSTAIYSLADEYITVISTQDFYALQKKAIKYDSVLFGGSKEAIKQFLLQLTAKKIPYHTNDELPLIGRHSKNYYHIFISFEETYAAEVNALLLENTTKKERKSGLNIF